jgi:hypothetical protein
MSQHIDQGASPDGDRAASLTASAVPASQSGIPSAVGVFTPGPWEWDYFGVGYAFCLVGSSPHHSNVRQNVNVRHDTPDGKLIAAAPELFSALSEAEEFLRRLGWVEDADKAFSVLSKAVGQ